MLLMTRRIAILTLLGCGLSAAAWAQAQAPAALPGKGLAQHDFFYAGEQKQHWMFRVEKGRIAWQYVDAASKGEISDATLLSNGDIVFTHQFGVTKISKDKRVLWNYDAPKGFEIHTAQPIGKQRVVFIQSGAAPVVRVVNVGTGKTEREFPLPAGNVKNVHGQLRHARLTPAGTLLVAHMDMKCVAEYDAHGKQVWKYEIDGPWSAMRLASGNTLIGTNKKLVREVDPQGRTVWEFSASDIPDYSIAGFQIATRLSNGNTLINNWFNQWNGTVDKSNPPVQAIEVNAARQVVWALRSWSDPDLGPSTTIQLLDRKSAPERVHFGDIR